MKLPFEIDGQKYYDLMEYTEKEYTLTINLEAVQNHFNIEVGRVFVKIHPCQHCSLFRIPNEVIK